MQAEYKILILDDHLMIRKGIRLTIETIFGLKDINEVSSCAALMKYLHSQKVTHLILDLLVSDGSTLEVIPSIRALYRDVKILVFTMQPPEVYALALKQYGIYEYLHKEASEEVTVTTLRRFLTTNTKGVQDTLDAAKAEKPFNPFSRLTARELEVLHYLLKGDGTKQVAQSLNLQMSTVSTLKSRIFEKTEASNIKDLIDLALLYNMST